MICRNNLRQVGLGANMYAEDNDLSVPRGASGASHQVWHQVFMPYLARKPRGDDYRTVDIYRCQRTFGKPPKSPHVHCFQYLGRLLFSCFMPTRKAFCPMVWNAVLRSTDER